jgi:ribose transport system ATP-binding protein
VLVLDEPTAALHGDEVGLLFEAVRRVAALGAGVVFISHRLDEVLDLPHRVVVLRDGRKVADVPTDSVSQGDLVRMIVGRELAETERTPAAHGDVALEVTGLQGPTVHNVDLTVRSGEIVGVTGILGSGREHLAGLVFGARPRAAGEVRVAGRTVSGGDPRAAVAAGVGFVPADRRASGGVMTMSARENLTLPLLAPLRRRLGWLDGSAERREALRWADELELRPPDPDRPLGLFSGGNQQKVVLAKWLRIKPTVLLLDEPTQGVDVGAKAAVYELIDGIAAQGAAVMVTSSDTKELAYLCDRVIVLRDGDIAAQVTHDTLTDERLVIESLGLKPEEASQLFGHELEVSDAR